MIVKMMKVGTLAVSTVMLSACMPKSTVQFERVDRSPQYEIVTAREQAEQAVRATPTQFLVKYGDDTETWNRSKLFFARYAGGFKSSAQASNSVKISIINLMEGDGRYLYRVSKTPVNDGYKYQVDCAPKYQPTINDLAQRNAQNLSRFIQTGTLEIELLDR